MAKVDFKKAKNITKAGAPVERDVKWTVEVTGENIEQLKAVSENQDLKVGDQVELEGQVFVKRMSFKASREASKAFEWDIDYEDVEKSKLKSVDSGQLQATQLLGTICEDAKGTPFFTSAQDVYDSDPSFIAALYQIADEVNNFMGKLVKKTSNETNSSENSSSTELAVAPSKKLNKK
ncbi:phage tail assembly chaperone family protein, TAC [Acinetobacter sp. NIPH 1958]|uniref:phage tail assembly chaperone family protein, TAC n=1 Tax=unclassified Acinetobacter TaxID=196816 RepID=UPI001F4A2266|nr:MULTISPECIES: phage tail assembly chaperone family protein, TAC [unclassified Acinetobacter]MCH7353265.1 phage tail assembly chaperone family protein, TAC [Acinetobacter sp. NIPH 2023]MCH7357678.1 phage tail assembly chaperone family protein, TAC [Acinetobacter sp. NIPH 1958]MCH7360647.1 phage tail assembly chaperone family protein, TAC [Acinetobacter sp. NIPH 2024]